MHTIVHRAVPCAFVKRGHQRDHRVNLAIFQHLRLLCGGQDANAQWFREEQHIPLPRAKVFIEPFGVHKSGYGEAVFWHIVKNAVSTRDDRTCFVDLAISTRENALHRALWHVLWNAEQVERKLWFSAHGVNIRECICRRNLPEGEGIVYYRRKKIDRLHQSQLIANAVDRGVIRVIKPHQKIFIRMCWQIAQQFCQRTRANLCAAAGAAGKLGEFYFCFHRYTSSFNPQCVLLIFLRLRG